MTKRHPLSPEQIIRAAGINSEVLVGYGKMTPEACAISIAIKHRVSSEAVFPYVVAMWRMLESV